MFLLSHNSPKLYCTTNDLGNIEIYAEANYQYPYIVAAELFNGSAGLTMDRAGTDVSGMTLITA